MQKYLLRLVTHENKISLQELKEMSKKMFEGLVKAVVDIEKEVMIVDASMHVDEEEVLLKQGSDQAHLWGINLHPDRKDETWIVFDSYINIRPSWGNRSRGIDDPAIGKKVRAVVEKLVVK